MGLFDFVSNIGKKLFSKPEEAAPKIQEEIAAAHLAIENLKVKFENGIAYLEGAAKTTADYEKAVLIAGNLQGVSSVDVTAFKKPEEPAQERVEYYVISQGDNLSKIAKKFYGDANKYKLIFEANKEVIKNADLIFPGQKIRIPNPEVTKQAA